MNQARRIVLAVYGLAVALAFLWVPWTDDTGYWWLWSRPKPLAVAGNDIVTEARRRWKVEHDANEVPIVGEKWVKALQATPEGERGKLRQEAKDSLALAKLRRAELSHRADMSDQEVLDWLSQKDNFNDTFPEKVNLDDASRQKLLEEWKKTVPPTKEWNGRVQYASIDYRRIGMELVALTALCAVGFVLSQRTQPTKL
jgi:hypothetical protein